MAVILRALDGFSETVSESQANLPAITGIVKSGLRLLEIDITLHLLCVEYIPDAQFQASFFFEDLFGNGSGSLSQGPHINLSFNTGGR